MSVEIVALLAVVVVIAVGVVVAAVVARGMSRMEDAVRSAADRRPPEAFPGTPQPMQPVQPMHPMQPMQPVQPVQVGAAPGGAPAATAVATATDPAARPPGVHVPEAQSPAETDPRFPWKARGTRKPLGLWDRVKFLLLFAVVFALLVWNEYLRIRPLGSFGEAARNELRSETWLPVLLGLELLRQLHFLVSERWAGYNRFWTVRVFGRTTAWWERKFNPWNRFRLARVVKWLLVLVLGAVVLGRYLDAPPVVALFEAPVLFVQALPTLLYVVFIVSIGILQFVAIFWFMSRGGVETYFPEDIETRFSDVWGQDHVLERVKENILLLENPEAIESRGGHVPGGILLWGPPGTGKTLIAEAVAGETGKPYVFVDPGAFQNMFFGVGILKVKALFRKLRKLALRYGGVIVFFDEADSLGNRGAQVGGAPAYSTGQATPAPWQNAGCHGFAHLSEHGRSILVDRTISAARPSPAPPLRVNRVVMPGMGGDMGTLQALLTEMSGLKKPRGFVNRVLRRTLGMRPKPPPKYRILVMMASNLPQTLDPALLREGRLDRKYKVGYPSKAGRVRTYEGYLNKIQHVLTPAQIDKLATITPYATGASIKDTVNEALIYAIGDDRDVVTWEDVIKAKQRKQLGPPEDVEYIERERHAVAVHEACHAVLAWKTRDHYEIDLATIEKGSDYLGMVASVKTEDQFTRWRSEHESDILVSLASLAGERLFFEGDNSSGVSGDLQSATLLAALMESQWGMGSSISSLPALQELQIGVGSPAQRGKGRGNGPGGTGAGIGFGAELAPRREEPPNDRMGERIEGNLARLFEQAERVLREHRAQVLALAHALETHKTLTGEDVVAVLEYAQGPIVDGRPYADPAFAAELEAYHAAAVAAHRNHAAVATPLPQPAVPRQQPAAPVVTGEVVPVPANGTGSAAPLSWGLGPSAAPPPHGQNGQNSTGGGSAEGGPHGGA